MQETKVVMDFNNLFPDLLSNGITNENMTMALTKKEKMDKQYFEQVKDQFKGFPLSLIGKKNDLIVELAEIKGKTANNGNSLYRDINELVNVLVNISKAGFTNGGKLFVHEDVNVPSFLDGGETVVIIAPSICEE